MNKNIAQLKVGTTLQNGKYTIEAVCGQGGFGITYKGAQRDLGVNVAIKEFFVNELCFRDANTNTVGITSPSKEHLVEHLRQKFHKEANGLFKLRHKNIVRTIDFFKENDTIYYVMDYINGPSLGKFLKTTAGGVLSEDKAFEFFLQLCDALSYIHKKKMLHLDVKPDNILIDESGENVFLIDFGLSKQYDEANGENTSELTGRTPGYSPIEQYENKIQHFTPATDIYALGATYYKMVTGKVPYTPSEILTFTKKGGHIPGTEKLNNISKAIIYNCLKTTSDERPQDIEELLEILKNTKKENISQSFKIRLNAFFKKEEVNAVSEPNEVINDDTELVLPPLLEFHNNNKHSIETDTRLTDSTLAKRKKRRKLVKKTYNYLIIGLAFVFVALSLYRFLDNSIGKDTSFDEVQYAALISTADSLKASEEITDRDSAVSVYKQAILLEPSKQETERVNAVIMALQTALFDTYMKFGDDERNAEYYDDAKAYYEKAKRHAVNETQLQQIEEKLQELE